MFNSAADADFYTHQIANSCRFDGTSYLTDTRASDGSATTGTISFWFKRSGMGEYGLYLMTAWQDGNNHLRVQYLANDTMEFRNETSGSVTHELETTQVFRDNSAWYHFVGIIDYTNGTQADRAQMWINGERVTAFETETYPSDASQTMVLNTGANLRWGAATDGGYDTEGYMAECVVIDGTAQAATDFGESKNGVWIPKDPSGLTFGTNGVYLKYESSGDMGNDSSGNNHDFALTNIAAHDQMKDSPTFSSDDGNRGKITRADVMHDKLFIECKLRAKHTVVSLWDDTAKLAKEEEKTPVIALCEKNRPGFWVMVHSSDLNKLNKIK